MGRRGSGCAGLFQIQLQGIVAGQRGPHSGAESNENKGLMPARLDSPSQGHEKEVQSALRVYRPAPAARVETRNGYPVQIRFFGLSRASDCCFRALALFGRLVDGGVLRQG